MGIKWTDEQQNAIDARSGTLLLSAAAGSGKTAVLVERIISRLTDEKNPIEPSELLVVTFTNAAAAEMRLKIARRINQYLDEDPNNNRLRELKMRLPDADIMTMDAYCIKLLRENYTLAGVQPDFSILDEANESLMRANAMQTILNSTIDDELPAELAAETGKKNYYELLADFFSGANAEDGIRKTIDKVYNISMSKAKPDDFLSSIQNMYGDKSDVFDTPWGKVLKERILDALDAASALLFDNVSICDESEKNHAGTTSFIATETELNEIAYKLRNENISMTELSKMLSNFKFPSRGKSPDLTEVQKELVKEKWDKAKKIINEDVKKLLPATDDESRQDLRALEPIQDALIGYVRQYSDLLFEMKKEKNQFTFSDIMHLALKIVASDDGTPTKRAREISETYREILIDEYQDTNDAQESFFKCLSRDGKNIFMVGDIKQSIYAFRNASPELFAEKYNSYPDYSKELEEKDEIENGSRILLGKNFRSRAGVLENINYLFKHIMSEKIGGLDYGEKEYLNYGGGYGDEELRDIDEFQVHIVAKDDDIYEESEADYIARLIHDMIHKDHIQVKDKNGEMRDSRPGDYCILMLSPKSNSRGDRYVKSLAKLGIDAKSEKSISIFDTKEVTILLNLLMSINNPSDSVHLTGYMLSALGGFTVDDLAKIKTDKKKSMYYCVRQASENGDEKCKALLETLRQYRYMSSVMALDDFVREVCDFSGLYQIIGSLNDGDERKMNLIKVCDLATDYVKSSTATLSGFIRYIRRCIENAKIEGVSRLATSERTVQVCSIHKSKGLEYPIVILADCSHKFNAMDIRESLIVAGELGIGMTRTEAKSLKRYDTVPYVAAKVKMSQNLISEKLRLLYVALTRAKEKAICVCAVKEFDKKMNKIRAAVDNNGRIIPYLLSKMDNFTDIIIAGLMPNKHFKHDTVPFGVTTEKSPSFIFRREDSLCILEKDTEHENSAPADDYIVGQIKQQAEYVYPYEYPTNIRPKNIASDFEKRSEDSAFIAKIKPSFCFSAGFSPAEIGTINHKFLQVCDFFDTDIDGQIKNMVKKNIFTFDESRVIRVDEMKKFITSELAERIRNSSGFYREKEFSLMLPIRVLTDDVQRNVADDEVLVVGKADLVLLENGVGTVVDYKTDRGKTEEEFVEMYAGQLNVYTRAMEKLLGIEMNPPAIYSLSLGKMIYA